MAVRIGPEHMVCSTVSARRPPLRIAVCLAWIAVAAAVVVACPARALAQSLTSRVQRVVNDARLESAKVGISVVDVATGRELVSIRSDAAEFIPASNLKLLTSGAALLALGTDFEFETRIVQSGGKLYVLGGGDPALADPYLLDEMGTSVDKILSRLVDAVKAAGVSGASELVVDDRIFDREGVHPGWPKDDLAKSFCAPVCGLNFHANVLDVFAGPGQSAGDRPLVKTEPRATWIDFDARDAVTSSDGQTRIWVEHGQSLNRYNLHGRVVQPLTKPIQVTVSDPGTFFGLLLADRLREAGVLVGDSTGAKRRDEPVSVRLARPHDPSAQEILDAEGARVLAVVRTPMSVVLERCNVDSENLYAEALLKNCGHVRTGQPGSWENGAAVVRMLVRERLGADMAASLVMVDGSGLARANRVSPALLTRWLASIAADPVVGADFVDSLAVAGEEGTVKNRFRGKTLRNEIRGKSGYIRAVRTLSGYVTDTATGRRLAYCVLVNDVPAKADAQSKEFHENVVLAIDKWLADQAAPSAAGASPAAAAGAGGR